MSSSHRNLEPLGRWHATIYIMYMYIFSGDVMGPGFTQKHLEIKNTVPEFTFEGYGEAILYALFINLQWLK